MDKSKIVKMIILLAAITLVAGVLLRQIQHNSLSLAEYEKQNFADAVEKDGNAEEPTDKKDEAPETAPADTPSDAQEIPSATTLTGAALNGEALLSDRVTYTDGFYYEPVSDALRRYITGISFPADEAEITLEELRYVHILHYDFNGESAEGELICNSAIAQDLVEIFYELYRNEYQLESVLLIEEFDGDDTASMAADNTSCFNYRPVPNTTKLSKHALGLAIDINPLYNPYITYNEDGTENVSPENAAAYADRSSSFSYKIDEDDLCYKLFTQHGFTWGGNWNSSKDYQHFQKTLP